MDCYQFEANISAYIEGELKQSERKGFLAHKEKCAHCLEKLTGTQELLSSLSGLQTVTTSPDFLQNLQVKIDQYQSRKEGLFQRVRHWRPFGLEPLPALGFALAFSVLLVSTYFVMNEEQLPAVDIQQYTGQSTGTHTPARVIDQPRVLAAHQAQPADSTQKDSAHSNTDRFNDQILMVNQTRGK